MVGEDHFRERAMYRVIKSLNHNAVLAVQSGTNQECLLMGKGIGFGRKVSERIEVGEGCTVYSLQNVSGKEKVRELLRDIPPQYLEISNEILNEAEKEFKAIDREILFPMADHIHFAVKRVKRGEVIANPLNQDIQVLFYKEYKAASKIRDLLRESDGIQITDDEIGYVALHVHAAICGEEVSSAMLIAGAVRECISMIEQDLGKKIEVQTLSYNLLMNHIKYMAARSISGEKLRLNMNRYMEQEFPEYFRIAKTICDHLGRHLKRELPELEIGYLTMHIARVYEEEAEE